MFSVLFIIFYQQTPGGKSAQNGKSNKEAIRTMSTEVFWWNIKANCQKKLIKKKVQPSSFFCNFTLNFSYIEDNQGFDTCSSGSHKIHTHEERHQKKNGLRIIWVNSALGSKLFRLPWLLKWPPHHHITPSPMESHASVSVHQEEEVEEEEESTYFILEVW